MSDTTPPATLIVRDGLHCVYGQCRGFPNGPGECNPGCSFTGSAQTFMLGAPYAIKLWPRHIPSVVITTPTRGD